jgi:hypothetical protein
VHAGSRSARGFQTSVYIYNKIMHATSIIIQNHENANVRNIGRGEPRHKEYKMLKLGGGQAYDHSSD